MERSCLPHGCWEDRGTVRKPDTSTSACPPVTYFLQQCPICESFHKASHRRSLPEKNATSCRPSPQCMSLCGRFPSQAETRTNRLPDGLDGGKVGNDFRALSLSSTKGTLLPWGWGRQGEGNSEEERAPKGNQT